MSWLKAEIEAAESGRLARRETEERAVMMMTNPVNVAEAYARFGLFLGLFPPAAIFSRLLAEGVEEYGWIFLFVVMNLVCCFVGRRTARFIACRMGEPREFSWPLMLPAALLFAVFWGVVTGGAGGLIGFIIGAIVGIACAVPVALVAFPVFALLHRQLSRGGMIEERSLWPLAFGIPFVAAAAILGY